MSRFLLNLVKTTVKKNLIDSQMQILSLLKNTLGKAEKKKFGKLFFLSR